MTANVPDTSILLGPGWIAEVPDTVSGPIDEYYERYGAVEPTLLHSQLMAGDPDQIENKVAAKWNTVVSCIGTVAGELRKALTEAKAVWEGHRYDEFQLELLPVMERAETLAAKAEKIQSGLTMMSTMLALAQKDAEAPPPPADATYEIPSTLDTTAGYTPSQAEQWRIQARLVRIVAELAFKYFLVEQKVWNAPLPTPEPIAAPAEPSPAAASGQQPSASPLDGDKPLPPPERYTHLVGPGSDVGGSSAGVVGGMPAVPMAAAMGGVGAGGDASSASRSRGWTSAETQWSSHGRPLWTDDRGGDPDPVVGDPALA